jgi:hypothetical protein
MVSECTPEKQLYCVRALAVFDDHAQAWRPVLAARYGEAQAEAIIQEARDRQRDIVAEMPYVGGDENPMLRHLIGSSTSLALYEAMRERSHAAMDVGRIIYDAVRERVLHLPLQRSLTPAELDQRRAEARRSHERRYAEDWVWDFVEGDGVAFDYGYDLFQCPTQRLYLSRGACEFLPYYCYLDFVTYRTEGWSFFRLMTLGEGHLKCDFRFGRGGVTEKGWPPFFTPPPQDER